MQEIINEAEVWFIDNGILPSSVKYNIYTQKEVLKYPQSTAILGVGKNRQGEYVGFAIELVQGQGVVYGGILEPDGIAMQGKKGLMRAIAENKPLVDMMQDIAQEHRTSLEYYERVSNEKGISLMEAMQQYPLPQYQSAPRSTPQEPSTPIKPQATPSVVEDENDDEADNWLFIKFTVQCYFFIIVGFLMTHNMGVPLLPKIFLGALSIFSVVFVCWMFWRVIKSIYVMYQYNTTWAIAGAITAFFGVAPLLIGIFYFTQELEVEDKEYIKQMFAIIGLFIAMSIISSLVLPPA